MTENNTTNDKTIFCNVCGTALVPSKKPITRDSQLKHDGSFTYGNKICPKCHPEYVSEE